MSKEDRFATGELPDISQMKFESPPELPESPLPVGEEAAPRRRGVGCLVAVLVVIAVIAACAAGAVLFVRSVGKTAVLLAGTDADGDRTDTIILAGADPSQRTVTLLSIPRDTYVSRPYDVPKINSAYGWAGGGQDGMEELARDVEEVTGLAPDHYILVSLETFAKAVDIMGGVYFDVPMDMQYDDPYQDLHIDLRAGRQLLDGEAALSLVRFRSGYALADLARVEVQRQFLMSAFRQWFTFSNVRLLPRLYSLFTQEIVTDMDTMDLIKLGICLLRCGSHSVDNLTLPGESAYIKGGSYFVADSGQVPGVMEKYF